MKTYFMRNKFYEEELRKQFGLVKNSSVKNLIKYLRNYYDWFYDCGRSTVILDNEEKQRKYMNDMLLSNVYNNFLYNRNLVNDPIMEQIHEMKLIEDEKK